MVRRVDLVDEDGKKEAGVRDANQTNDALA